MTLRTVRVPEGLTPLFAEAEAVVSRYFAERKFDPEHGTIEVAGERYVLVRAASLSVEFFRLCEDLYGPGREVEAAEFSRNILFDLAHAIGKSDAKNFHARMGLDDPIARLSAGPVHFAHTGWAFVDISPESKPLPNEEFFLLFDHPYSFEADAWLRAGHSRVFPVCIMNAGYSSGWCEESFGVTLVAAEIFCRAKGDATCRFVMAHPQRIEANVARIVGTTVPEGAHAHARPSIPDFFSRKRMEDELRGAHDELERRVEERTLALVQANERLLVEIEQRERAERQLAQAHKLEALGRVAGGVAHDFNNLIAVILANGAMLRDRTHGAREKAFVDEIVGACGRAAKLTKQLLAFGRSQAIVRAPLDLRDVARAAVQMLERVIREDVELRVDLGESSAFVLADSTQLDQVIVNLVVNARDAMPRGGVITVTIDRTSITEERAAELQVQSGPFVRLRVRDEGTGIDETVLPHIFDPFFTTKSSGDGTGLGLTTVYGVVRQTDGAITVESRVGVGTTISVYLPEVPPKTEQRAPPDVDPRPRGAETILLVEDQAELRNILETILRDHGYEVLVARDAEDAVTIAAQHPGPVHLLLTDVVMPKLNGPEVAARVLALLPHIRVLFMSGYAEERVLEGARGRASEVPWIEKPFGAGELARRVRAVLDA